ncbi:hypothetical protein BJ508DRAFT_177636 [Ascobolus immersus RN42]|uniref:Uncharacterized protein n=1 Tax=Ascobolus immersus RN42 TaxID=1160509 RepID=A0A3N4IV87_ASCIM|nr:hypothetical protein BJ508DRAFT_177636 [Ascobolus immersus RN42]
MFGCFTYLVGLYGNIYSRVCRRLVSLAFIWCLSIFIRCCYYLLVYWISFFFSYLFCFIKDCCIILLYFASLSSFQFGI